MRIDVRSDFQPCRFINSIDDLQRYISTTGKTFSQPLGWKKLIMCQICEATKYSPCMISDEQFLLKDLNFSKPYVTILNYEKYPNLYGECVASISNFTEAKAIHGPKKNIPFFRITKVSVIQKSSSAKILILIENALEYSYSLDTISQLKKPHIITFNVPHPPLPVGMMPVTSIIDWLKISSAAYAYVEFSQKKKWYDYAQKTPVARFYKWIVYQFIQNNLWKEDYIFIGSGAKNFKLVVNIKALIEVINLSGVEEIDVPDFGIMHFY